ncbi:MAG: hypothetical protein KDA21_05990 [Phycisphaerales bacterium]|nr:hypothetical protein [Phycisphaerales bacterium]
MSWEDRYKEGGAWHDNTASGWAGRSGRFFRWLFDNPENPLGWSVFLFRFRGITVRLHLITILFMAVLLIRSISTGAAGVGYMAIAVGSLFLLVLLHEFGHCFACRWSGGDANRVVMLPWGGLALTRPADGWRAHLVTTVGGPAVNVLIFPLTTMLLVLLGEQDVILFNLLSPSTAAGQVYGSMLVVRQAVFWLHAVNLYLLLFNLALVMYPFDGGRIVQELLWARLGYRRSMEIAVLVGFGGALVLGAIGLATDAANLVIIAVFGALACWQERQRVRAGAIPDADEYGLWRSVEADEAPGPAETARLIRKQEKAAEQERAQHAEVDRILAKIAAEGMGSLTRREKRILEGETKKRRGS